MTDLDVDRLRQWLVAVVDPSVGSIAVERIAGGNSSGATRVDLTTAAGPGALVLKLPNEGGMVFDCDASREGRILVAGGAAGAPVAPVVAVDETGDVLGRPCFVMAFVAGRSVPESTPASFHGDGWFRDADDATQRRVWWSFLDCLARLHAVPGEAVPDAWYEPGGVDGFLGYWRRSLLDALPAELAPRQLAAIDWLAANAPADAEEQPVLCMGDARLGNALLTGEVVHTLVDFEVAYVGNPAADIGYCLLHERFTRLLTDRPATGIPDPDETWAHWEAASGRSVASRAYWTAFGATVLCVTGTRAMLRWGVPPDTLEADSLVVPEWEALVDRAG